MPDYSAGKMLHVLHKGNFAKPAIKLFERYAPGKSSYLFSEIVAQNRLEGLDVIPEVWPNLLTSGKAKKSLLAQIEDDNITAVFFHALTKRKAELASYLKKHSTVKIFWIFFGAELYMPLNQWGVYELYDQPDPDWKRMLRLLSGELQSLVVRGVSRSRAIRNGVRDVDFFCFWNNYDYELLKKNFVTDCRHLDFIYHDLLVKRPKEIETKLSGHVLVNHSASISGNHLAVLEKLSSIDQEKKLSITTPLSYGDPTVRAETIEKGSTYWGDRYCAMTKYLPQDEYYKKLSTFSAAVFGSRRQEAGANIFYLLAIGAKVFLRSDNNMLLWLRDRSFKVFCVEEDLKEISDLDPLPIAVATRNRAQYLKIFSTQQEKMMMQNLLVEALK